MLTPIASPRPRRALHARDERGFTLVETLVAMVTGVIITGALFAILDISVKQSSRLSETAQATQLGRATMTRIQDMLHSACLSPKFTPVEEGSSESKLVFLNSYGEKAEVPTAWTTREVTEGGVTRKYSEGVRKDEIEWSEKASTLTDTYATATAETSAGKYSFGAGKAVKIGENLTKIAATPIFTYYEYATTASSGTTSAASTLQVKKPPTSAEGGFKEAEANKIAAVAVSFNVAPNDTQATVAKRTKEARTADLTSSTTFAFSAPNSEATITAGPCE